MTVNVKYGPIRVIYSKNIRPVIDTNIGTSENIANSGTSTQGVFVTPPNVSQDEPWACTVKAVDAGVYVAVGPNPTASATPSHTDDDASVYIPAGGQDDFVMGAGYRVAVISAA